MSFAEAINETQLLKHLVEPCEVKERPMVDEREGIPTYAFVVDKPTDDLMMIVAAIYMFRIKSLFIVIVNNGDPQRMAAHFRGYLDVVAEGVHVDIVVMRTMNYDSKGEPMYCRHERVTPHVVCDEFFPYITKDLVKEKIKVMGCGFERVFVTAPHRYVFGLEWFSAVKSKQPEIVMGGAGFNGLSGYDHLDAESLRMQFVLEARIVNRYGFRQRLCNNVVSYGKEEGKYGGKFNVDSKMGWSMLASPLGLAVFIGVKESECFCVDTLCKQLDGLQDELERSGNRFVVFPSVRVREMYDLFVANDVLGALDEYEKLKSDVKVLMPYLKNQEYVQRAMKGMDEIFAGKIPSVEWTDFSNLVVSERCGANFHPAEYSIMNLGKNQIVTITPAHAEEDSNMKCAFGVSVSQVEGMTCEFLSYLTLSGQVSKNDVVSFYERMGVTPQFAKHVVPQAFLDQESFEAIVGYNPYLSKNAWWGGLVELCGK